MSLPLSRVALYRSNQTYTSVALYRCMGVGVLHLCHPIACPVRPKAPLPTTLVGGQQPIRKNTHLDCKHSSPQKQTLGKLGQVHILRLPHLFGISGSTRCLPFNSCGVLKTDPCQPLQQVVLFHQSRALRIPAPRRLQARD